MTNTYHLKKEKMKHNTLVHNRSWWWCLSLYLTTLKLVVVFHSDGEERFHFMIRRQDVVVTAWTNSNPSSRRRLPGTCNQNEMNLFNDLKMDKRYSNNNKRISSYGICTTQHIQQLQPRFGTTTTSTTTTTTSLKMISNLWGSGNNDKKNLPTLPRDVKEAVTKCREATQAALQNRISRMDIDFPVGTKFNVEKEKNTKNNKKNQNGSSTNDLPTKDDFDKSDRELARLFVEMFQPVGSDRIVVIFKDVNCADMAKDIWKKESGDDTTSCRIVSLDRRKSKTSMGGISKSKKNNNNNKPKGFAAKMAMELDPNTEDNNNNGSGGPFQLPMDTEVAIFVAPGSKELPIIERISTNDVGMGTLIILLNARKLGMKSFGSPSATKLFTEEFQTIFHLGSANTVVDFTTAASSSSGVLLNNNGGSSTDTSATTTTTAIVPNCLLYHTYQKPWILARKPKVGPPQTILVTKDTKSPTPKECIDSYNESMMNLSDIEKNVEKTFDNVANWFR